GNLHSWADLYGQAIEQSVDGMPDEQAAARWTLIEQTVRNLGGDDLDPDEVRNHLLGKMVGIQADDVTAIDSAERILNRMKVTFHLVNDSPSNDDPVGNAVSDQKGSAVEVQHALRRLGLAGA